MSEQNQPTNTAADIALKVAHAAAFKLILPYIMKKALAKAAWLALPVINPIFVFFAEKYFTLLYDEQALNIYFQVTNFKTKEQGEEAKKAAIDLATAINQGVSDEELKRLSDEFDARMAAAIHTNQ